MSEDTAGSDGEELGGTEAEAEPADESGELSMEPAGDSADELDDDVVSELLLPGVEALVSDLPEQADRASSELLAITNASRNLDFRFPITAASRTVPT